MVEAESLRWGEVGDCVKGNCRLVNHAQLFGGPWIVAGQPGDRDSTSNQQGLGGLPFYTRSLRLAVSCDFIKGTWPISVETTRAAFFHVAK
jgi:hypothetical protein